MEILVMIAIITLGMAALYINSKRKGKMAKAKEESYVETEQEIKDLMEE